MLQYYQRHGTVFLGQIHDALLAEFPTSGGYREIYRMMKEMEEETELLPGFRCPCKVEVGKHWGFMKELRLDGDELVFEWSDPAGGKKTYIAPANDKNLLVDRI